MVPGATSTAVSLRQERKREVQQHLGYLDSLRGLAVVGVILIHTGQAFMNPWFPWMNAPGMRGVQVFFLVSAFTLLLSSDRRQQEPRPVLSFLLRRFFRLGPLYYPFVLLAYYTAPPLHALSWRHTWPALLFLHDFFS